MEDQEQPKGQEQQRQQAGMMDSIVMAFNMGVSAHQQTAGTASVVEMAGELGEAIYSNLSRAYGGQHQEEFLRANTEFFLQIALLGYIIPGVCAYDEGLKNRLFGLIEAKLSRIQQQRGDSENKGVIIP